MQTLGLGLYNCFALASQSPWKVRILWTLTEDPLVALFQTDLTGNDNLNIFAKTAAPQWPSWIYHWMGNMLGFWQWILFLPEQWWVEDVTEGSSLASYWSSIKFHHGHKKVWLLCCRMTGEVRSRELTMNGPAPLSVPRGSCGGATRNKSSLYSSVEPVHSLQGGATTPFTDEQTEVQRG